MLHPKQATTAAQSWTLIYLTVVSRSYDHRIFVSWAPFYSWTSFHRRKFPNKEQIRFISNNQVGISLIGNKFVSTTMHLKHKKKIYPITDDLALISKILTPTFDAEVITLGLRAFHDRSEICTLSSSLYCKKNQNTRWSTLIFFLRKPSNQNLLFKKTK